MATPADQRLLELLEKWLKSLELHIRYSSLDADSYSKIQPWPDHERPSRWIIDLAMQKALALRTQVQERIKIGDAKFSDSLELMTFLANLIGSGHIERFIPLADPENERVLERAAPPEAGRQPPADRAAPATAGTQAAGTRDAAGMRDAAAIPDTAPAAETVPSVDTAATTVNAAAPAAQIAPARDIAGPPDTAASATREMPGFVAGSGRAQPDATTASATREMPEFVVAKRQAAPVGTEQVARTERRPGTLKPAPRIPPKDGKLTAPVRQAPPVKHAATIKHAAAAKPAAGARPAAHPSASADAARDQVIADAARLVQWGRKWFELAELIARMADRPPLPEVRRILKDNKTTIEKKVAGS